MTVPVFGHHELDLLARHHHYHGAIEREVLLQRLELCVFHKRFFVNVPAGTAIEVQLLFFKLRHQRAILPCEGIGGRAVLPVRQAVSTVAARYGLRLELNDALHKMAGPHRPLDFASRGWFERQNKGDRLRERGGMGHEHCRAGRQDENAAHRWRWGSTRDVEMTLRSSLKKNSYCGGCFCFEAVGFLGPIPQSRGAMWQGGGLSWACRVLPQLCLRNLFGCAKPERGSQRRFSVLPVLLVACSCFLGVGLLTLAPSRGAKQLTRPALLLGAAPGTPASTHHLAATTGGEAKRRAQQASDAAASADRGSAFSVEWQRFIPELAATMSVLRDCGQQLRHDFDHLDVEQLYACDASESRGPLNPECVTEAKRHVKAITEPSQGGLDRYRQRVAARAAKWPRGRPGCSPRTDSFRPLPKFNHHVGEEPNASVWVGDFGHCGSGEDRYIIYLRANTGEVVGQLGGLSGRFRLDHLTDASILGDGSVNSESRPRLGSTKLSDCSRRVQKEVENLGRQHKGFLRYAPTVSFRGLFWYPPGGFDSWHTDGTLAQGWRVYLIDRDPRFGANIERGDVAGYLAYRDPSDGSFRRAYDDSSFVNVFEVSGSHPLWHAVHSAQGHRLSVGIAISDAMAATIRQRLKDYATAQSAL